MRAAPAVLLSLTDQLRPAPTNLDLMPCDPCVLVLSPRSLLLSRILVSEERLACRLLVLVPRAWLVPAVFPSRRALTEQRSRSPFRFPHSDRVLYLR